MQTYSSVPEYPPESAPPSYSSLRDAAWTLGVHSLMLFLVLCLSILFKNLQRVSHNHLAFLSLSAEQDVRVSVLLNLFLDHAQASRVLVAQFHNGENLVSGRPFLRMTVTHEALAPAISSMAKTVQGVPLSKLASEISNLIEHKVMRYSATDPTLPPRCVQYLRHYGIDHVVQYLLYDGEHALGLLAFHYCGCKPIEFDEQQMRLLILDLVYVLRFPNLRSRFLGPLLKAFLG